MACKDFKCSKEECYIPTCKKNGGSTAEYILCGCYNCLHYGANHCIPWCWLHSKPAEEVLMNNSKFPVDLPF